MTKREELYRDVIDCQVMAHHYSLKAMQARDAGEKIAACKLQREAAYWADDARYLMGIH